MSFKIEFITLFPELFKHFLESALLGRAIKAGRVSVQLTNPRDFAEPPHFKVDDEIYGGGPGMLMKPEPLVAAIRSARSRLPTAKVIYLTPGGQLFNQSTARDLSRLSEVIFVCGRYEGIDQRVIDQHVDLELSIGDYVLMGGELPAMVVTEASVRLLDSVLGNEESARQDSFTNSEYLEGPQYTRPPIFEGQAVPAVLLSGDHSAIAKWRQQMAIEKTARVRPDLANKEGLTSERG